MRELLIDRLKNSGWLDYGWTGRSPYTYEPQTYLAYLRILDDDDLLDTYSRISIAENELD